MDLINRLKTAEQVRAVFNLLTPEEREQLSLRRDFRGRLIIDLSRLFHSGSVQLDKVWKMPIGEGDRQTWQSVATEPSMELEVPQDFVQHLFGAAVQHPWFQQQLIDYYGSVPEIEL